MTKLSIYVGSDSRWYRASETDEAGARRRRWYRHVNGRPVHWAGLWRKSRIGSPAFLSAVAAAARGAAVLEAGQLPLPF